MKKLIFLLTIILFVGCTNCDLKSQTIPDIFVYVDPDCNYTVADFRVIFDYMDNCGIKDTIQLPAPGTIVSIVTSPTVSVEVIARDFSDNIARVTFNVILIDSIPPIIIPKAILIGEFGIYPLVGGSKLRATPITMRGAGMIEELAGYHPGYDDAKMILGLYSDLDGKPNKLMATTGEVQCDTAAGWQIARVTEPVRLNDGQKLWLSFITDQSENNQGFMASPVDRMSDVSANYGMYTGSMPLEFGESTQWQWGHSIHMRYSRIETRPPEILAQDYLAVEAYINTQIDGYVNEFDWSTAAMDTIFKQPKCIPIGQICPPEQ